MTATALLLALTLTSIKLEASQLKAPALGPLALPELPKVDGPLRATGKDAELTAREGAGTQAIKLAPARIEEVQLGKSFAPGLRGLKAVEPLDLVALPRLPAAVPAFKACARLASPDRTPTRLKVTVLLPGGGELTSASRSVWFDGEWADVVVDFVGLKVSSPGLYKVVFSLDGAPVAELPLEIRTLKQAAEPSGR